MSLDMTWSEWKAKYDALKAKKNRNPEEEEQLEYMQQKLDDWISDGENSY